MDILFFHPLLLLSFSGYFLWTYYVKQYNASTSQKNALAIIKNIFQLLEYLPKHRGASSAVISGDSSFEKNIPPLQNNIDSNLSQIVNIECSEDKLKQAREAWDKLKREYKKLSAPDNFNRHTTIIGMIIDLAKDVAEDSFLLNKNAKNMSPIRNAALNRLPDILELLGQSRGLATMIISQERNDATSKIKLQYIVENITKAWQGTYMQILLDLKASSKIHCVSESQVNEVNSALSSYLKLITLELISSEKLAIEAKIVFEEGTRVIDKLLELNRSIVDLIESQIAAGNRSMSNAKPIVLALGVFASFPLIYFLVDFFVPS